MTQPKLAIVALALMSLVWSPRASAQHIERFTAQTEGPASRQGSFFAGLIRWTCAGTTCTADAAAIAFNAVACAALARQVGPLVAYGRDGAALTPAQLARCNGLQPNIGDLTHAPPLAPGTINTIELTLVGGEVSRPAPDIPPVVISTPTLSLVGGALTAPPPDRAPAEITTSELSLVGAGPDLPDLTHLPTPH